MSKRQLVGLSLAVVILAAIGAAVTMPLPKIGFGFALGIPDQVLVDRSEVESMISQLQAWLAEATTTTEAPTTTAEPTTTEAPTTTAEPTTTAAPTTTTRVRPTTTVPGTTSTTAPPIPPPVHAGANYTVQLQNVTTGERWWDALYHRDLSNGYGWDDGDKAGYKCLHGHLIALDDDTPDDNPSLGRVTFTRISGASYAGLNDKFMIEGSRHFDGTPVIPPSNTVQIECPAPTQTYEQVADVTDERPIVNYVTAGGVLETRNYQGLVASPNVRFQQIEKLDGEMTVLNGEGNPTTAYGVVTVVAYALEDGLWSPALVVYYHSLHPDVDVVSDLP